MSSVPVNEDIFHRAGTAYEAVTFIDDGRGDRSDQSDSLIYFFARTFFEEDLEKVAALLELLKKAGTQHWHAKKGSRLFRSSYCSQIFESLAATNSKAFDFHERLGSLAAIERLKNDFVSLVSRFPELRGQFSRRSVSGENPYASSLFLFIEYLTREVNRSPHLIVCDKLDWTSEAHSRFKGPV